MAKAKAKQTDAPEATPDAATPRALLDGVLAWLRGPESDKGWQNLCSADPTPAIAVSYLVRDGLTSKSRPQDGTVEASDAHPAEIVATYPDGRRIVTRNDDGAFLLGVGSDHALATMRLQMASFTKICEADDPFAMAEEIHGAAAKRAAEEAERKRQQRVKRAERALLDAYEEGDPELITVAEAYARKLGIDPATVKA